MESPLCNYAEIGEGQHSRGRDSDNQMGPGNGRRKREFISDEKKDASYWEKRRKNNEAAKRSREKRRFHDLVLEGRVAALDEENGRLRSELLQLKLRFGLIKAASFLEAGHGLGGCKSGDAGPLLCTGSNSTYSSSYLGMNSDSSEADSGGGAVNDSYSPRGSLSDLSDQSSRGSPVPASYGDERTMENDFANMCPAENNPSSRLAVPRGGVILYGVGGLTVDPQTRHLASPELADLGPLKHFVSDSNPAPLRSSIFVHADSLQTQYQQLMKTTAEDNVRRELRSPKSPHSGYHSEDSYSEEGAYHCSPLESPTFRDLSASVKLPHKLRLKSRSHGQEGWRLDMGHREEN
ncbi:nuclear factor interleukin-3-regulated protein-like [Hyla sarda]|uniref:nuclear factor interleukin-3-regulated protein-like n=1 Tax=Hyla sarda TaxID=327740 RepID=UPI0024C2CE19|nr:nuclear factor interleukin-3-regulated protein-like [Hyla sarda]XP_056426326.1 nuclear factor interleukin-3-regulated protein-like [Hyla sarda]XP_056426327.1 nuclear factor interleukin-3-regulated protein-like [Hyla sarda]XP_056426328.1 nuclear factor interleukin-3-regulated protein-like [Hyla sarda]XP_056426329.1 nuclear factor interleukin-3-regulated protein-like [Hyla sarda]XP_056426330.1 nuclear factor interleukin-3-regulated protein-like [Hyla sarda]XP_056426331.1 nuclear factor inter